MTADAGLVHLPDCQRPRHRNTVEPSFLSPLRHTRGSDSHRRPVASRNRDKVPSSTTPAPSSTTDYPHVATVSASPSSAAVVQSSFPLRLSIMSRVSRAWASPANLFTIALAVLALLAPVSAVRIPFQNCLDESYRTSDPLPLQWVPLYADAVFGHDDRPHSLSVTVWGNVTGSQNDAPLPPAGDPYWTNDEEFNGKIILSANLDDQHPLATTLLSKVDVVTYETWSDRFNFCNSALQGAQCPLSPVFDYVNQTLPEGLPYFNLTHDFGSSYAFTSFSPQFTIIYGDRSAQKIACVAATITPDLGSITWILRFMPILILIFTGLAVIMSAILSPWGTTNIFHWTSNYGRDADLLRLVTPGFGDCLQYIQFVFLSGSLSLNYPGFFQPAISQAGWSALMFNQSFISSEDSWQSVVDGIYVTDGPYGLQRTSQLIGLPKNEDIWAGMMVWLCVVIAIVFVLVQVGFLFRWLYRLFMNTSEEDLRAKNMPFSVGNIVRIVFNYFLLPIVALSCFQLVVAGQSPTFTVALAVITLVVLAAFASWLLYLIITTRPKAALFDDLPTVLRYGPLYNTYSDEAAAFALIPIMLTFVRGIGIGAVQPSGIAQVVVLAICEVIHLLSLHAFRPFHSPTSMNAYHTLYSVMRLITIMLMVAFSPTLNVDDGTRGWVGYAILLIHGAVLVFCFFVNALATVVEVVARMLGAGGDDAQGLTRGGLSKIFGMRQLSRRATPRGGPSRASQLSTSAMLDAEDGSKVGYSMPGGRLRSESGASLGGVLTYGRQRNSSALDSIDLFHPGIRHTDTGSSYMPGTPGESSTFSFLPSPTAARHPGAATPVEASDPYYRPPRRRKDTLTEVLEADKQRSSVVVDPKRLSLAGSALPDPTEADSEGVPAGTGGAANNSPNRPDYSTREVDFYYGVRGPALNSEGLGRKLGTGPADPTGPVATATGWFRTMFGGKSKEKGKGFEVVRSARMPPSMMTRNGGFGDETPPEGIPVAMGVLRKGPIDSDDEDETPRVVQSPASASGNLLNEDGDPHLSDGEEPDSPLAKSRLSKGRVGTIKSSRGVENGLTDGGGEDLDLPEIPRKSSKRHSAYASGSPSAEALESFSQRQANSGAPRLDVPIPSGNDNYLSTTSRLPFDRSGSLKHSPSNSSMETPEDYANMEELETRKERPFSLGTVPHHGVSRVDVTDRNIDLLGSSAELVDENGVPTQRSRS